MRVFLGGTCAGSTWRDDLIPLLKIDYFNPVVPEWDETAYQEELKQREECDFCLYVVTPKMKGVYSIAEVIDDSNKRPEKTIFCSIPDSEPENRKILIFTAELRKSVEAVGKMVKANGGEYFNSLQEVADYLNMECTDETL
jgi:hypothetical protein